MILQGGSQTLAQYVSLGTISKQMIQESGSEISAQHVLLGRMNDVIKFG